jgi:hypothetical protein
VLSGFRPGVARDLGRPEPAPYADGNKALWEPGVRIQHPLAEVEIMCFDNTAPLLLSPDVYVNVKRGLRSEISDDSCETLENGGRPRVHGRHRLATRLVGVPE